MIEWGRPAAFWALLAVCALAVVVWRLLDRRRDALARFADAGLIDRLVVGLAPRRRRLRALLRCAALALLVCAAAAPRWGFRWEEVRREGLDLIVALDTSRSMLATDVAPNRLERAKLAVMDLVGRLDGDRIGLVAFAGTAFLECPLTLDYAAFERTLRALHVGIIPRGGTALARAIDEALESFEARQGKYQALILITDGEDHEGDIDAAAKRAADAGVKVFTVGIGTTEGELLPAGDASGYFKDRQGNVVKSRLDETSLANIAGATDGAHVRGLGPSLGLDEVFRDHIAGMERRDVGSRLERRWEERFQLPVALALMLLLVEAALGDAAARRLSFRRLRARLARSASAAVVAAFLGVTAVSPAHAAEDLGATGYERYAAGDYEAAAESWRQGLIDEPDSPLLHFNLGAALFRGAKYEEAAQEFAKTATAAAPEWTAKAAYNLGNALYRVGQAAEQAEPKKAITSWEQALEAYRSAMAADPADEDPKFDYELVSKRLKALREKLEKEEQEKQEQAGDEPQQDQPQEPQDQQDEQGEPQEENQDQQDQASERRGEQGEQDEQGADGAEEPQPQPQPQDGAAQEQPPAEPEQEQGQEPSGEQESEAQAGAEEKAPENEPPQDESEAQSGEGEAQPSEDGAEPPMGEGTPLAGGEGEVPPDEQAARAVLDAVRREELGPDDVNRAQAGGMVADALKDW